MTHYESAIDEIAGRLQGTDASLTNSIAEILAAALQELIEAELTGTIGADHGERTPTRTAQCNGRRPKLLRWRSPNLPRVAHRSSPPGVGVGGVRLVTQRDRLS